MKVDALRQEGYDLLHFGAIELALVEANGIRIDVERLRETRQDLTERIRLIKEQLRGTEVWELWRKRFGEKSNLGSRLQFGDVFYRQLGFKPVKETEAGGDAADEEALRSIDHPFVDPYLKMFGYEKTVGTFLNGIESETCNGRLHPVFNLHTVLTYRSSSDSPNFQNFPARDKELAKLVRSVFIASPGCVLVENDFKGIEVGISACYHKDPNFISYITTPGKDMHRDMAAQLFKLDVSQVGKEARQIAKSSFVFPQFYGDFWGACAKYIWKGIDAEKIMVGKDKDISLREHLTSEGFTELGEYDEEMNVPPGTFMAHVKDVQDDFWNNRFQVYGQWRRDFYNQYLKDGYFDILTGFRVGGVVRKNAVTNYPVQGSAFHCLLWTLIEVNRTLRERGMKAKVVGQIHDSLIGDVPVDELREYLQIVEHTVSVRLRERYEWLNVPLEIEYEICPVDGSWFEKREVKFKQGQFKHPSKDLWTDGAAKFLRSLQIMEIKQPVFQNRAFGHKS